MATVRELVTRFGFDIQDGPLQKMDGAIDSAKANLIKMTAAATAAAVGIFKLTESTAKYGDEVAKTAVQIGVTTDELQEMSHVAALGGASQSEFTNGIRKFSRSLAEARDGQALYMDSFKKLGMTEDEVNDKTIGTVDLMTKLADKFKVMPAGADKTALAMELFGRAGTKMIPMFNQGSEAIEKYRQEARDLGVVMGEDALKNSEAFVDAQHRLQQVVLGVRNAIGSKLLPMFIELFDKFRNIVSVNRELIATKIDKFIKSLIKFIKGFVSIMTTLYKVVNGVVQVFGGWENIIQGVLTAMLILFGLNMLNAIGSMAMGLFTIVKGMKTLRMATLLTNAAMAVIPILIGMAVVAIGLLFEDLVGYVQGRDSVVGKIEVAFENMFTKLNGWWEGFGLTAKLVIAGILLPVRVLLAAVRSIGGVLGALSMGDLGGAFDAIKEGVVGAIAPDTSNIASMIGLSSDNVKPNQQSNVNAPITVNVPPGTPPEEVANAARQGIGDSLGLLFEDTERQLRSPVVE